MSLSLYFSLSLCLARFTDVICFQNYRGRGDVFVFSYGCVVFWGLSEDEEARFLRDIATAQTDSLAEAESDDFLFSEGLKSDILSDSITLCTNDILEKLSASFAIAQSVKLSVFEERIENQIESNKHLPERLAKHGKIALDRTEISKKIGQVRRMNDLARAISPSDFSFHFFIAAPPVLTPRSYSLKETA